MCSSEAGVAPRGHSLTVDFAPREPSIYTKESPYGGVLSSRELEC